MLTRASRIANHLAHTKVAGPLGLAIRGAGKGLQGAGRLLFGGMEKFKASPLKSMGRAIGIGGGVGIAGYGAHQGLQEAKQDIGPQGFAQRMGYGG